MKMRMNWLWLQVAVLALAIAANTQCFVTCAANPCHDAQVAYGRNDPSKLPPCHRQHPTKQPPLASPCVLTAFLPQSRDAFVTPAELAQDGGLLALPVHSAHVTIPEFTRGLIQHEAPSPPASQRAFFTVLRI